MQTKYPRRCLWIGCRQTSSSQGAANRRCCTSFGDVMLRARHWVELMSFPCTCSVMDRPVPHSLSFVHTVLFACRTLFNQMWLPSGLKKYGIHVHNWFLFSHNHRNLLHQLLSLTSCMNFSVKRRFSREFTCIQTCLKSKNFHLRTNIYTNKMFV